MKIEEHLSGIGLSDVGLFRKQVQPANDQDNWKHVSVALTVYQMRCDTMLCLWTRLSIMTTWIESYNLTRLKPDIGCARNETIASLHWMKPMNVEPVRARTQTRTYGHSSFQRMEYLRKPSTPAKTWAGTEAA